MFGERVVHIKGGALVRVFAVPQRGRQGHGHGQGGGRGQAGRRGTARTPTTPTPAPADLAPQPLRDRRVVRRRVRKGLPRQAGAQGQAGLVVSLPPQAVQQGAVVGRVDDDRHGRVVFGGRTNHRGPANVDVFDGDLIRRGRVGIRHCCPERVQVDNHDVDEADARAVDGGHVFCVAPDRENAAVHRRVERFDAAAQHFGEARQGVDPGDGQAGGFEGGRGAARGDELVAQGGQALRVRVFREVLCEDGWMDGEVDARSPSKPPLSPSLPPLSLYLGQVDDARLVRHGDEGLLARA
jgi:hypothetical protein